MIPIQHLECSLLNTLMGADLLIPEVEGTDLVMDIEEAEIMVTMITETTDIMITGILKMVTSGIMEMLEIMEILIV